MTIPTQHDVSASIVAYKNAPPQLLRSIQSFLNTPLKVRLLVIDNSPTTALRSLCCENGAEYVSPGRNLGFGAAHNVGIIRSGEPAKCAKYHLILNPDVYFGPGVLEELCAYMDANPRIGLTMPQVLYPGGSIQHLCKLLPTPAELILRRTIVGPLKNLLRARIEAYELRNADHAVIRTVPVLSGCFLFIRTEVFKSVGLFDERYFMYLEDVDLCRRVHSAFDVVYYPRVSVFHEYAKGSYKDGKLLGYHIKSACKYFSKWGWLFDRERELINKKALNQPRTHYSVRSLESLGPQAGRDRSRAEATPLTGF